MAIDYSHEIIARWSDLDPKHVPLIRDGGITAVLPERQDAAFESALKDAGIRVVGPNEIQFVKQADLDKAAPGAVVAFTGGNWPGITRGSSGGSNDETASASRQPWIDADSFWVHWLRTMYPNRPALLGYKPDADAGVKPDRIIQFDTLELALIDAWSAGGNYILALEPRLREALLKGDDRAQKAWKNLGRTAKWLRENAGLFGKPVLPYVTLLVEGGDETVELANLAYRQNASPLLAQASNPPRPDPARRLAIVAANLHAPKTEIRNRILAHATAGATVVVAGPAAEAWWKNDKLKPLKTQEDRDFFSLGKGQVIAYKDQIADPSDFALDMIDVVTHRRRAVRVWNALSLIAIGTSVDPAKGVDMIAVNYGYPVNNDMQARIQGVFTKAQLLRPEKPPVDLKPAKRGTSTEVMIPQVERLAVVRFS